MIDSALIVGGGVGGMSAAISLRRLGVSVTLIDADPEWRAYGAGISVTGLSLRAFDDLGVLDEVRRYGFVGAGMRVKDTAGQLIFSAPVPDEPAPVDCGGGIMRPVLHGILSSVVKREGVEVRLGLKVAALDLDERGVDVRFTDGAAGRYHLVVGADGIFSSVREMLFLDAQKPQFTGQGCWRVVAPRPADVDRTEMYVGGPVKLGLNPVSEEQLYLFLLDHAPDNPWYAPDALLPRMSELLAPFGGLIATIRAGLGPASLVHYRPLEWLLMPDPWYRGRVVLVGDAAHATTPHLASGAGLAAEDGIVLAQELAGRDSVEAGLRAFMDRRFERARFVVETSVEIGRMEMSGAKAGLADTTIGRSLHELRTPY